jgi:septum site-determining protein MinC
LGRIVSIDPKLIVIKGMRDGLSASLPNEGSWAEVLAAFESLLTAAPAFYKGGRVALIVGSRRLDEADMRQARDVLARYDVTLWAVAGEDAETQRVAAGLGLDDKLPGAASATTPVTPPERAGELDLASIPIDEWPDAGLIVRRTLRSGQTLRHPRSIVVIGDVNPGAEIVAGGDIVVWGKLRGTVHAGALGDESAVVCALDLAPTQLRIGGRITRSPDERRRKPVPETARVRDGQIVAEPWGS